MARGFPPRHLQWATDPSGRRYWVTGGPTFGFNPLVSLIKGLLGSKAHAKAEVRGHVTVTLVEGDQRTEVFETDCNTWEEARAQGKSLAEQIQAGTFKEHPHGDA
jgi:hypothetical protein